MHLIEGNIFLMIHGIDFKIYNDWSVQQQR